MKHIRRFYICWDVTIKSTLVYIRERFIHKNLVYLNWRGHVQIIKIIINDLIKEAEAT